MKKSARFVLLLVTLCMITISLSSCTHQDIKTPLPTEGKSVVHSSSTPPDQGITNSTNYPDYTFWESPVTLKLVSNFNLVVKDNSTTTPSSKFSSLSDDMMQVVNKLKQGIINFFIVNYKINVEKRLNQQEIRVRSFTQASSEMYTLGCIDKNNPRIVWLNASLLTDEFSYLFNQVYVHETIHFLGISHEIDGLLYEGLTDALTDKVLTSIGLEFHGTDAYMEPRILAYQILSADKELIRLYLLDKEFSLKERISQRLANVECVLEPCTDSGQRLVDALTIIYNWHNGNFKNYDMFPIVYDAQSIIYSYCKSFKPNHETITYIRSHYLINDFETFNPEMFLIEQKLNSNKNAAEQD